MMTCISPKGTSGRIPLKTLPALCIALFLAINPGGVVFAKGSALEIAGPNPETVTKDGMLPAHKGLGIFQRFSLNRKVHGIDGEIQLLQDDRLAEEIRSNLWFSGEANGCISAEWAKKATKEEGFDNTHRPFYEEGLAGTVLRIVDSAGRVMLSQEYACRPLAKLQRKSLYDHGPPTYLLTLDESVGMGSHNGPVTYFFDVAGGQIVWLTAKDKKTGKMVPMTFVSAVQTGWKIASARNHRGKEIKTINCRFNLDKRREKDAGVRTDDDYVIDTKRYVYEGKQWIRYERSRPGYWDLEVGY